MELDKNDVFFYRIRRFIMTRFLDEVDVFDARTCESSADSIPVESDLLSDEDTDGIEFTSREMKFHRHSFCQLAMVLRGTCRYIVNGKWYKINSGDIIFINTDIAHSWFAEKDSEAIFLTFSISDPSLFECFSAYADQIRILFSHAYPVLLIRNADSEHDIISELIMRVIQEEQERRPAYVEMIHTSIMQITLVLLRMCFPLEGCAQQKRYPDSITRALEYINKNLRNEISISDVAAYVYMNVSYFSHIFRKTLGITFSQYVVIQRLSIVASELEKTDKSITNIATESGFSSLSSFYRHFTQYYGRPPAEYRRMIQQQQIIDVNNIRG